jgi:hypothetical protein
MSMFVCVCVHVCASMCVRVCVRLYSIAACMGLAAAAGVAVVSALGFCPLGATRRQRRYSGVLWGTHRVLWGTLGGADLVRLDDGAGRERDGLAVLEEPKHRPLRHLPADRR